MPNTDKIQWPQGQPQFELHWRAITEALGGNGVVSTGDFEVTATANDLEIQVAPGTAFYAGTSHTLGSASSFTLTSGDSSDDRWDTIYFDTSTDTAGVREGTPGTNPEPPDIQGDEILLATVYVAATATNVSDSEILNWRTHSNDADNTYLKDSGSEFSSDTVENAFQEVIREQGDPLTGDIDLSSFTGSAPFNLGTNPGAFGTIIDAVVDSNSTQGTTHSYDFDIDGTTFLRVTAESDGAGGLQNAVVSLPQGTSLPAGDIDTGDLASGSVTSAKISDGTIQEVDIDSTIDLETWRSRDGTISGPIDAGTNPGVFGAILDATVDSNPTAGTEESYSFSIDGTDVLTVYGEADGSGGVQNIRVQFDSPAWLQTVSSEPSDAAQGNTVYDTSIDSPIYGNGSTYQRPLSRPNVEEFSADESGSVASGNSGIIWATSVPDGGTIEILQGYLLLSDGQPAPSGLDLSLISLDNTGGAARQSIILSGDGSAIYDDETGSPLASYNNTSGSAQTVAIVIDNGNFNSGTGASQDVIGGGRGEII